MTVVEFECPKCGEQIKADLKDAGQSGNCPACNAVIEVPSTVRDVSRPPALPRMPPPLPRPSVAPPLGTKVQQAATIKSLITAGWICFGVGIGIAPLIITAPLCGALFFASMILGIVLIAKGRTAAGIGLLVSSIAAPPLLFLGLFAAIVSSVFGPASRGFPGIPAPAQPAATVTQELLPVRQSVQLRQFLMQLESVARPYRDAQTSVRRDEARREIHAATQRLLDRTELTFSAVVTDVQVPREGAARILFKSDDIDNSVFWSRDVVSVTRLMSHIDLNMPRNQALAITPGTGLAISGRAVFLTSANGAPANPPNQAQQLVAITFARDSQPLGRICLQNIQCRTVQSQPKGR